MRDPIWWNARLDLDWQQRANYVLRFRRFISANEIGAVHNILPMFRDKSLTDVRTALGDRAVLPLDMLRPDEVFRMESSARALNLEVDIEEI